MKKTITLTGPEQRAQARRLIEFLPDDGPLHKVTIEPVSKKRSTDANSLYWKWETVIGGELGNTKEAQHEWSKENFLVPIFYRDDEDYRAMIEAVKNCRKQGLKTEADAMKKVIIQLTSTTRCNVSQMREFMNMISLHADSLGIKLPSNIE